MNICKEGPFYFYEEEGILKEIILTGFDLNAEMQEMEDRGICSVWLNRHFCGDRINDMSFLKSNSKITKVCIVDSDFDCSAISEMKQLEYLQITTNSPIDLSHLFNLNTLITNSIGINGLPPNIETLHLWDFKFKDGSLRKKWFPDNLKCLELFKTNLICPSVLPVGLKRLGIHYDRRLMSLDGLDSVSNTLEELELDHCPHLTDYSNLEYCYNLKKVILVKCGNISSLSLLKNANNLSYLSISGMLVTDKDISCTSSIPYLYISNRRYYT